mmetsp:Transcript_110161/g.318431  ORF Transcript_110161/g.318431 Transcript_110161/m.318431 type:complete len:83 (-) Transcript_110161:1674-1922(-)
MPQVAKQHFWDIQEAWEADNALDSAGEMPPWKSRFSNELLHCVRKPCCSSSANSKPIKANITLEPPLRLFSSSNSSCHPLEG